VTLDYEDHTPYHEFLLMKIDTNSTHPVRNTHGQLISGMHTLCLPSGDPSNYWDKDGAPLQPNVAGYEFGSSVANSGILHVTVQRRSPQVVNTEAIFIGLVNGKEIIRGDRFIFKGVLVDIAVKARVVSPATSEKPFVSAAEVHRVARQVLSSKDLVLCGKGVARKRHLAFNNAIRLDFLRLVMLRLRTNDFLADTAQHVFPGYHKRHDTQARRHYCKHLVPLLRASRLDMSLKGGKFALGRYLLRKRTPNSAVGTAFDVVNCHNQAGRVELACSFQSHTGWLYLQPFVYIKLIHFIGVGKVNNPFFQKTPPTPPSIIRPIPAGHLSETMPSTVASQTCIGSTIVSTTHTLDRILALKPSCNTSVTLSTKYILLLLLLPEMSRREKAPTCSRGAHCIAPHLAYDAVASISGIAAYADWARLDTWLKPTLGYSLGVDYEKVSVLGEGSTQAFWQISDANAPNDPICVHIDVYSVVGEDSHLYMTQSAAAAGEHAENLLMSTQLANAWTSGKLPNIGAYLRYSDDVAAGRIVIIVRNPVIDIAGMAPTAALHPIALKPINRHTRARDTPESPDGSPHPVLQIQAVSDNATLSDSTVTTDIHTRFTVVFSVSRDIVTARAICDGDGVLFGRYEVGDLDGVGCKVEFFLVAHKAGRHDVRVCAADSETICGTSFDLEVEVERD
ncbi:hypothetical protein DXG01_004492, partial [Tephrocybe rancida]